ncbi:sigma-70 family RNA polymerase sigma factor [Streptomyces sp. NPDC093252]|uniref:RNA polymerase sigma factor n=1 Tax=Streptomyces sp. NPDC093252 TaxID=3154980 RepID=UPI0034191F4A
MENTCVATAMTMPSPTTDPADLTGPAAARPPGGPAPRTAGAGAAAELTDPMTAAEFDEAFTAVMPRLRRRLLALTGNPHDADDLVQETYLRLSRRARSRTLVRQQQPYAYTCAAALNLLRDLWRHPSRQERCTDRLPERGWDGGFARREAEAVATALLRGLSAKEAAAVILVDIEGLTHDAAALRLGAHRGTVQRNRMRGLAKIRATLHAYEPAAPAVSPAQGAEPGPTARTGRAGRAGQAGRPAPDTRTGPTTRSR